MEKIKKKIAAQIAAKLKEFDKRPRSELIGGDITREMLAKKAGVSKTTFFKVLKGKASLDSMVKVAQTLEIELI